MNNNNGYTYYDYNAAGLIKNRMSDSDTSWLIWNGDKLVCDYTLNNGVKTYSHGVDGVLFQKFNSNITYYLKNSHGNIVSECSTDGTIAATNTFDAYGNTNLSSNGFGYCGEYQDVETNLTYLRARFYDQTTGTFVSEDLVKDGLNWCCQAMVASYYLGDKIDRTLSIASYVKATITGSISYNAPCQWISSDKLWLHLGYKQNQYGFTLLDYEIENILTLQKPIGVLYGIWDDETDELKYGHWVVIRGFSTASEHHSLYITNDPWDGSSNIQNYEELNRYTWGRSWYETAY